MGFGDTMAATPPPVLTTSIVSVARNFPPVLRSPSRVTDTVFVPLGNPANKPLMSAFEKHAASSWIPFPSLSAPILAFPASARIWLVPYLIVIVDSRTDVMRKEPPTGSICEHQVALPEPRRIVPYPFVMNARAEN